MRVTVSRDLSPAITSLTDGRKGDTGHCQRPSSLDPWVTSVAGNGRSCDTTLKELENRGRRWNALCCLACPLYLHQVVEYASTVVSLGKKKGTLTHDIGDESGGGGGGIVNGEKKMGFRRRPDVVLFLFYGREKKNL